MLYKISVRGLGWLIGVLCVLDDSNSWARGLAPSCSLDCRQQLNTLGQRSLAEDSSHHHIVSPLPGGFLAAFETCHCG